MGTLGRGRMPARRAWLAAVALLVQPLLVVGAHAAVADGSSDVRAGTTAAGSNAGADLSPEQAASQKAADSGDPVEVTSETTPTDTVTALPDGTFRLDASPVPVRAKQGDAWVPLDTTLQAGADGLIRPKAAAVDVAFSGGGGSTALATVSQGGTSYSISAPWSLPVPTVSGSSATYSSVLPDVDLVVSAVADGFTENVVVKTRTAAQDPGLASLRFPVTEHGLTAKAQESGGAVLVDGHGRPVFSTGSALAWDSATGSDSGGSGDSADSVGTKARSAAGTLAGPADTVVAPGPGSNTDVMGVDVTDSAMTVTPDPSFMADPLTVYPVVLDPQTTSQSLAGWTALWSGQPSTSFWKTTHTLGVGYDLPEDTKIVRSLYQFDTHGVAGKKVLSATFTAEEVWSYNCTAKEVDLWHTGGISSSSTYNKQPSWMGHIDSVTTAKGWSSDCPGGNVEFDATSAVAYGAVRDGSTTTLGLRAASESDEGAWKQFASPHDTKAVLSVTYVSPPKTPAQSSLKLASPYLACGINKAAAVKISDATPALSAVPLSADGSQATLRPNFEVHQYDASAADPVVGSGSPSAWTTSGKAGTWTSGSLKNGQTYWFRARTQYQYSYNGTNGSMYSGWTAGCWFTIDTSRPPQPAIASTSYPQCAAPDDPDTCLPNGGVGVAGTFTITPGAGDVVSYTYTLNDEKPVTKAFTADLVVVPNQERVNALTVYTTDGAGNTSDSASYFFDVSPGAAAVDNWSFDEGSGTTGADSAGGNTATLEGTAGWSGKGRIGSALSLDGQPGSASVSASGLDTSKSFTLSAWARLSDLTQTSVVVSQDATSSSSFSLYYSPSYGRWVFNRNASDVPTPTVIRSISTAVPAAGVWTHLLGVYDSTAQTIELYVNGVAQGDPVAFTTPWKSTGPLRIGGGQYNDKPANFFPGQVDEVQLWDRIVSSQEAAGLQTMTDPATGLARQAAAADWELDATANGKFTDSSGYGRDATATSGVSQYDDVDGNMGDVVSLDGSSGSLSTAGPIVDAQGDFTVSIWVNLDVAALADTTTAHTMRIAGQAGTTRDSWGLWYTQAAGQSEGRWVFGRTSEDSTSATTTTAPADVTSGVLADPGVWTMLTGVYDSANGTIQLYVNDQQQDAVSEDPSAQGAGAGTVFTTPWQASGAFTIGGNRTGSGTFGAPMKGLVAKAKVWTGLVGDVSDLYQRERPKDPDGGFPDE